MPSFADVVSNYVPQDNGGGNQVNWGSFASGLQPPVYQQPSYSEQQMPQWGGDNGYQGGNFSWQDFVNQYSQVKEANQKNMYGSGNQSMYQQNRGTEGMYNNYRAANGFDTAAIKAGEIGDWFMNLPSNLAGLAGNQQLANDLRFDASKFDLTNGFDNDDVKQIMNFGLSLPGMIPGGIFEGLEKGYEAITGAPVQENRQKNDGSYEIANYTLDAGQRAAAGLDAFIDLAGTATGASGKALSVLGKGLGRAAEKQFMRAGEKALAGSADEAIAGFNKGAQFQERANRIGEMTTNMGRGLFDTSGLGKGAQLAYNVGEEAGEEFAQSYLEDWRFKQLDENSLNRAMTGAAWGAVGGGLMHGGGALLNKAIHGRKDAEYAGGANDPNTDPQQQIQAGKSEQEQFESFRSRNDGYAGRDWTPSILARARENLKDPEKIPASTSAFGTTFADDLDVTQVRLTDGMLEAAIQADDNGLSIQGIADMFHVPASVIEDVSKMTDLRSRSDMWKSLLENAKKQGPVRIVCGRNPDTNEIGTHYVDVVDIVEGNGVQLNSNAWKMLGGDVDGDRYQSYFYPQKGVRAAGYLTKSLVNPITGRSNLDSDYVTFVGDNKARRGFTNSLRDVNAEFFTNKPISTKRFGELVGKFGSANSKGLDDVSIFFTDLRNELFSHTDENLSASERGNIADRSIAKIMHDIHLHVTKTKRDFETVYNDLHANQQAQLTEAMNVVDEDFRYLRSGDSKGLTHFVEFADIFGQRTGINLGVNLGNAIMRQSGAIYYGSHEDQDIWFDNSLNSKEVQDRYKSLIAFSFALENVGADVENAIEGVFWTSVVDSTMTRFTSQNGRIGLDGNWNQFLDMLVEEYQSKAKDFNDVLTRPSTSYDFDIVIGSKKNESLGESIQGKAQIFHKAFGNFIAGELFALDKNNPLYDMTINQIISEYALNTGKDYGPFSNIPGFSDFFHYIVNDEGSNFRALGSRYDEMIANFAEKLVEYGFADVTEQITVHRDSNGKITGVETNVVDESALLYAIDAANYIFGEDESTYLGIGSVSGFLTTQWGKEWMSADQKRMINAVIAAKMSFLYKDAINLATTQPAGWQNDVQYILEDLASKGGIIEHIILSEWIQNKNLDFLKILTDLDIEYGKKEQLWDQMSQKANPNVKAFGNLLAEVLASQNSDLGTAAFTKKLKNAKRSMAEVSQRSTIHLREVLQNIKSLDNVSSQQKLMAIKHLAQTQYTTMSTNAIAAFVHSQRDVVKGMVDKGVAPTTSDIVYQMSERMKNGGLFSFLEGIDYGMGVMKIGSLQTNRVQILKALFDPKVKLRCYDPAQDGYIWISQEAIFEEVLGKNHGMNPQTQWEAWEKLFDRCPQLASLIAPTHIGTRTADGNASVVEGSRIPLDKAIVNFVKDSKDVTREYDRKRLENEAIEIAMRDPNWWSAFVADIPGVSKSQSLAETHDLVRNTLRKHTNWLLTYASMKTNSASYFAKCSQIGKIASAQAWNSLQNVVDDANLSGLLRITLGTTENSLNGAMLNNTMKSVVNMGLSSICNKYQLGWNGAAVTNSPTTQQEFVEGMQNQFDEFNQQFADNVSQTAGAMGKLSNSWLRSIYTLFNMVDTRMFRYNEYVRSFGLFEEFNSKLDDFVADNPTDPTVQQKAEAIKRELNNMADGGINSFITFVFGYNPIKQANVENAFPDVIPSYAVTDWTQEQFMDAVHNICDKFNYDEYKSKADKDIRRAFENNSIDDKENIKNYFNQLILEYDIKAMSGAGTRVNMLASKQKLEAYKTMFSIGDKIRDIMGDRLEQSDKPLPDLDFDFDDITTSAMSSHMAMNAASGSITTGIGLDGSMLNLVAGFGLLDEHVCGADPIEIQPHFLNDYYVGWSYIVDKETGKTGHLSRYDIRKLSKGTESILVYNPNTCLCGSCATCAPALKSNAAMRGDGSNIVPPIGKSIESLINYIQEPRHLKAKKSLGVLTAFDDPMSIDSEMNRAYSPQEIRNLNNGRAMNARELILGSLNMRRDHLRESLHELFVDPDIAGDLHFDVDRHDNEHYAQSTMFAGLMCNMIEVHVEPDIANEVPGGIYYVSASALANDDTFAARGYDFGWGAGVINSDNVRFVPVAMSLQEVSERIIRHVANKYFEAEANNSNPSTKDIRGWASEAMNNWDSYNSNPLTMSRFLDGIVPNPAAVDNAMLGDMNYSARMLWNDKTTEMLTSTLAPKSISRLRAMSDNAWNQVQAFNSALIKRNPNVNFFTNNRIVSVEVDSNLPSNIGFTAHNTLSDDIDTGTALSRYDNKTNNTYDLVEMYAGSSATVAKQVYRHASDLGRDVLIPSDLVKYVEQMSNVSGIDIAGAQSITIDGVEYKLLRPHYRNYLESFQKESIQLPTTQMDPDEISIAIGSYRRLGLPDAGHYTHPDFRSSKLYSEAIDIVPTKILNTGMGAVSLVTDLNELKNIKLDDIDFGYYEHNIKNKALSVYRNNTSSFLDMVSQWDEMPRCMKDIKQDQCIGFIKQPRSNGKYIYAPLFYEGSVAENADTVMLDEQRNRGTIRMLVASQNVDYNGKQSMKLDMYGVAYKSVGHIADSETLKKWAAIDDGGFNVVTRADHMFDAQSVGSRLIEMGDAILHRNIYFFTRKSGINAFYRQEGNSWVLRDDLNEQMTPAVIEDLCNGSNEAWARVADGTYSIYKDAKQNAYMMRATSDILELGGFPHLMFNSARIIDGNFVGLERRFFDPRAVFRYWNTDDFLAFWNHFDNRLCPATMDENPNTKDNVKVFDRHGYMLDCNTVSGQPERKVTLIGPHFYTGDGTAIGDLSRGATWSNQHVLKRLLASGIYRKDIRNTIDALSVAVNGFDHVVREESVKKQIEEWRKHKGNEHPEVNQELLERAKRATEDPLYLSVIEQRRKQLIDIADEISDPLLIVQSTNNQEAAFNDEIMRRDMENLVESLNKALGDPSRMNKLTMSEVVMLVRLTTGFTSNNGRGISNITFGQFKAAVETMVSNLNNNEPIIKGGKYNTRGDDRVSIPLMPKGLATRVISTPYYERRYHGNVKQMLDDQYEMLSGATVDYIKTIKSPSKRNALLRMADAMCYANGRDSVSGHLIDDVYMWDLMQASRDFAFALTSYDPELAAKYDEAVRINDEWANKVLDSERLRKTSRVDMGNGNYEIIFHGDDRNILTYVARQMAAARRSMGLTYLEMPLSNILDRAVGNTALSWAMRLGRIGVGPYKVNNRMSDDARIKAVENPDLKKFWLALREAQMLGVDRELMNYIYNGEDLDTAINNALKNQGIIERFNNKLMNLMTLPSVGVEKQIRNFIDRTWQRSETEAPWWHQKLPGHDMTLFEERLVEDPVGLMTDLFSGSGEGKAADMLMTRQNLNFALAGDMAQKNLVSAIFSEIAKRSALADVTMTTFVTPYFQYATNRLGKVLNAIAPISSLHYIATEFMTQGPGGTLRFGLTDSSFGDLGLEEVQVKSSLKEAIFCDMCHMGGTLVAMTLAGLALTAGNILEPPEDDDKKGNFEEWTVFGLRVNANWWIEDSLGIALPLATFMVSAMRGEPRIDLITNGLSHYLGNNPVAKVADAVSVLFDPMSELYREYEQDLEGYAKAMGGAPDIWAIMKGKATSFGLSYVSQFITPGFLREIYQATQGNEVAYKRVFETDATGKLSLDARENNATQYTSYEDAVIRKFTKDNPVMGFLADIIMRPTTGYMNHEMPDRIVYDPTQMNSMEAFSIYQDPYTKKFEKPYEEQYVIALMVISALQSNSVESLKQQGFMIDYDTKKVVSQVIWDMIATENNQWADLEQSGALSYYNAGYGSYDDNVRVISEMRETHKTYINNLKSLYHDKLWAEDLGSITMYTQKNTEWAQDVNGNWYATGFAPTLLWPVTIADGESPGIPQAVMSRENDWETQSSATGKPTGQRSLVPVDAGRVQMPDKPRLESWSSDGTTTGYSDFHNDLVSSGLASADSSDKNKSTTASGYPRSSGSGYGYRSSGGYSRGGGGGGYRSGGGRSYTPNISAPNADAPVNSMSVPRTGMSKISPSRIMGGDRLVEPGEMYLRPDFETKGSREAYKRSDI